MSHIWERHEDNWVPRPLNDSCHILPHDCELRKAGTKGSLIAPEAWYLVCSSGAAVRVNGETIMLGTRMMRDRDELLIEGQRLFFSAEKLAKIVAFQAAAGPAVICARCKQPLKEGDPAVECPSCGAWHHQSQELGCWLYGGSCALCDQPTALDAGFRWTPQEVWS